MSYELNTDITSQVFYIDSRDATSYLATNSNGDNITSYFQYTLQQPIIIPQGMYCLTYLHSATIPYSFYNIRTDINDVLIWSYSDFDGSNASGNQTLTIPSGNYTAFSFAQYIEDTIGKVLNPSGVSNATLNFVYDQDQQKYTYDFTSGYTRSGGWKINFLFSNASTNCGVEMGFSNADVLFSLTTLGASTSLTSSNVVDLTGNIHGVFVRTNLTSISTFDSATGNISSILARMPIKVNRGGVIFAEPKNTSVHKALIQLKQISTLTIRITDERNRVLDLNGLHLQIAIGFEYIKKINPLIEPNNEERRNSSIMNKYNTLGDFAREGRVGKAVFKPDESGGFTVERRDVLRKEKARELGLVPPIKEETQPKKEETKKINDEKTKI